MNPATPGGNDVVGSLQLNHTWKTLGCDMNRSFCHTVGSTLALGATPRIYAPTAFSPLVIQWQGGIYDA
jgi:hypothetical protein